jgi:SOS response regulatory protein OraA/RecX
VTPEQRQQRTEAAMVALHILGVRTVSSGDLDRVLAAADRAVPVVAEADSDRAVGKLAEELSRVEMERDLALKALGFESYEDAREQMLERLRGRSTPH